MAVSVEGLVKRFGAYTALDDVSLDGRDGEFLALLGPSGSGKTTLLRIMAGLEFPDLGVVKFDGEDVSSRPTGERRVGFVFQHYALFRHMTVAKNVAFGLEVKPRGERPPKAEIARRVDELLGLVQLGQMGGRYPAQLSGGQRQRVALARALAVGPRVLLLDEPFGALDAKVRKELRGWLRRVHDEMGLTSIFVTHDQEEALELADRVVIMNHARIEQVGTPEEVYASPATPFVCGFLGQSNELPCVMDGEWLEVGGVRLVNSGPARGQGPGVAFVRPHDIRLLPRGGGSGAGSGTAGGPEAGWPAVVRRVARAGVFAEVELETLGQTVEAAVLEVEPWVRPGAEVLAVPGAARGFLAS